MSHRDRRKEKIAAQAEAKVAIVPPWHAALLIEYASRGQHRYGCLVGHRRRSSPGAVCVASAESFASELLTATARQARPGNGARPGPPPTPTRAPAPTALKRFQNLRARRRRRAHWSTSSRWTSTRPSTVEASGASTLDPEADARRRAGLLGDLRALVVNRYLVNTEGTMPRSHCSPGEA